MMFWRSIPATPKPGTTWPSCGSSAPVLLRRREFAFPLPEPIFELRKQLQRVIAQNLLADAQGVLFEQVAALHFFREHFGQAAARQLGGAVDALGMVAIRAPHDA